MLTRGAMDLTVKPGARMPKGRPYFQKASKEGKTEQKKGKNKKSRGRKAVKVAAMKQMGPRRMSV